MGAAVWVGVFYVIISVVEVTFIFLAAFANNEIPQWISVSSDFLRLIFTLLAVYAGFRVAVRIMRK